MVVKAKIKTCTQCGEIQPLSSFARGQRVCKLCHRRNHLVEKYGITPEDYEVMLAEQHNRCVICGKDQSEEGFALAVDHDHDSGKIRGLLCQKCNRGLGDFRDDSRLLRRAADYLERNR